MIVPIVMGMSTTRKPVARSKRPAHRRRDQTSRPSWSVPSQCAQDGSLQDLREVLLQGRVAVDPRREQATRTRMPRMIAPAMSERLCAALRSMGCERTTSPRARPPDRRRPWLPTGRVLTTTGSAGRARRGVRSVDEVDDDHRQREDEGDTLDDGEVAVADRGEHQAAEAVELEHPLDDHRRADEEGDVDAQQRERRDDGVAGDVDQQHAVLAEALGARRGDVVGLEDLEHADAQAADQKRHDRQRRGEAGQDETVDVSGIVSPQPPTGNQPRFTAKMRMRTRPTQNDGIPRPTRGTARMTWSAERSLRIAAIVASGTVISMLKTRGESHQRHGHADAAGDERARGHLIEERRTRVTVCQLLEEQPELDPDRLVQSPARAQRARSVPASRDCRAASSRDRPVSAATERT